MQKLLVNVVGMTKFSGVVGEGADRGRVKSCKLFVLLPMESVDRKNGEDELGRKGSQIVEYKTDDLRIWDELKGHNFPVQAEMELETFAQAKGGTVDRLMSVKARGTVKAA